MTTERATFAGGCFWCTESVFKHVEGVDSVVSGYTGGETDDPTYKEVCTGKTGHAEAVQVSYDPDVVSYRELLEIFFSTHDPTTLNRQGPDVGSQYRSAVFYHDDEQRREVESLVDELESSDEYPYGKGDIVTEINELEEFYEAEEYHQDYYDKNPGNAYCNANIEPKLRKLRKKFSDTVESDV
ncbi:MAG: peptide-methionine (S)-S-oxide reductase MsrA [Halobacteria archaeon]|nr:peptide-methionine (S)-S-oxide reductase MsrA [Halobacteria archaeon]